MTTERDARLAVDPVTLEVLRNGLYSVSDEMVAGLIRASYSTNIKDRRDCSCGIYTSDGDVIAMSEFGGTPLHLGTMHPAVRTVFEMVNDIVLQRNSPRTASLNEAIDRGADYSTMAIVRDSGSSSGAARLNDQLPDAQTSVHVHDKAHLDDSYFSWGTQVDDLGLEQMRQLWASPESAPTLTWWANVVSDAGHHAGGPRSDIARDSLRDSDSRLVSFLEHLDRLGITDQVTFLLTADHGFEGSDPAVTGSWRPALESLGIPFRDEGPGFIYLLPDS